MALAKGRRSSLPPPTANFHPASSLPAKTAQRPPQRARRAEELGHELAKRQHHDGHARVPRRVRADVTGKEARGQGGDGRGEGDVGEVVPHEQPGEGARQVGVGLLDDPRRRASRAGEVDDPPPAHGEEARLGAGAERGEGEGEQGGDGEEAVLHAPSIAHREAGMARNLGAGARIEWADSRVAHRLPKRPHTSTKSSGLPQAQQYFARAGFSAPQYIHFFMTMILAGIPGRMLPALLSFKVIPVRACQQGKPRTEAGDNPCGNPGKQCMKDCKRHCGSLSPSWFPSRLGWQLIACCCD